MFAYSLNEIHNDLVKCDFTPDIETNEILVEILMSGINHRDLWIQKGLYPGIELPVVMGSDGLVLHNNKKYILNPNQSWGTNPKIPSKSYNIRGLQKQGTFATHTAVLSGQLFEKSAHLTDAEAAVLPLAGLTAYRALISNCDLKKGERVLINGIGGGVALQAAQFAIALGAEVYVTSSSEDKIQKAVNLRIQAMEY